MPPCVYASLLYLGIRHYSLEGILLPWAHGPGLSLGENSTSLSEVGLPATSKANYRAPWVIGPRKWAPRAACHTCPRASWGALRRPAPRRPVGRPFGPS